MYFGPLILRHVFDMVHIQSCVLLEWAKSAKLGWIKIRSMYLKQDNPYKKEKH